MRTLILLSFVSFLAIISSCKDEDPVDDTVTISPVDSIAGTYEGSEHYLIIEGEPGSLDTLTNTSTTNLAFVHKINKDSLAIKWETDMHGGWDYFRYDSTNTYSLSFGIGLDLDGTFDLDTDSLNLTQTATTYPDSNSTTFIHQHIFEFRGKKQ